MFYGSLPQFDFTNSREKVKNVSFLSVSRALHIPSWQSIENLSRDNFKKEAHPIKYLVAETKNSCSYNPGVVR